MRFFPFTVLVTTLSLASGTAIPPPLATMTTTGGVYAREKDNWEGACGHFILALRACVNFQGKTPSGYVNSFGPDYGTVCDIYALPDCVGMHIAGVAYPGLTEYTEHDDAGEKGGRSYVCYV